MQDSKLIHKIKRLSLIKIESLSIRIINWQLVAFILVGLICIWSVIFSTPKIYGDGFEYLGMTISIAQHGTPELKNTDVMERRNLVTQKPGIGWNQPTTADYTGYFEAKNGKEYSYHFWLYSGLCTIYYLILKGLNLNPLNVFLATNIILMLFLLGWILYRPRINQRTRIWLFIFSVLSPILLYIPWSHPEVFIYVFLLIGLIELINGYIPIGTMFIAISATQGSPLTIIGLAALVYQLWQFKIKRLPFNYLNILLSLVTIFLLVLPYAFYWFNFGTPSLIAGGSSSPANLQDITLSKIISLFLDPNFGLIIYVPLLLVILVVLIVKRKTIAIIGALALIISAVLCATQKNWNSGMMYINRYGVWILPILVISTAAYFGRLNSKWFRIHVTILLITTGLVTSLCMLRFDGANSVKFGPVARAVLSIAPSIYNPPFDVYAERVMGSENSYGDKLPLMIGNSNGLRKSLIFDKSKNTLVYVNGSPQFTTDFNLKVLQAGDSNNDIAHLNNGLISFSSGWYPLESNAQGDKWRWMDQSSTFDFSLSDSATSMQIQMKIASLQVPRPCIISINGKQCFEGNIGISDQQIQFQSPIISGTNHMTIISPQGATRPSDIPQLNSQDNRSLSFLIKNIEIIKN